MENSITNKREKQKKISKEWYKNNKLRQADNMKKYYEKNKLELTIYQKEYKLRKNGYNQPMKNKIRSTLINEIKRYEFNNILTLESKEFLFSKQFPDKKIIVFERDLDIYNELKEKKPKNVSLFLGDISAFSEIDTKVDVIYLDLNSTWITEQEVVNDLKEHIKNCKLFAITLNLRDKSEKIGDYEFYLISKIQSLLKLNLKVIYGESYNDTCPMVTILFENIHG